MKPSCLLLLLLHNVLPSHQAYLAKSAPATILFQWVFPEFNYPNEWIRHEEIQQGQFLPENILMIDVDYHAPTSRFFVTTPLVQGGIPATLSVLVDGGGQRPPLLNPFPHWPYNYDGRPTCDGLVSVYRIAIDKCGLLWAFDTGRYNFGPHPRNPWDCPPKLLVYDLNNYDREILRYEFPNGTFTDRSFGLSIVTESYRSDCSDTVAYIADSTDYGLVVFDYASRTSYRIENKLFKLYPTEITILVNGLYSDLIVGLVGLALGPPTKASNDRLLYFHSFASVRESWVPVSVLKDRASATDAEIGRTAFVLSPGVRAGQSNPEVMTDDGILIYSLVPENALACWNSRTPFTLEHQHILLKDDENFQYITGMKLMGNKLLFVSDRLQNYESGNSNGTDVKYRVMLIKDVKSLLRNSPCASSPGFNRRSSFDSGLSRGGFSVWPYFRNQYL